MDRKIRATSTRVKAAGILLGFCAAVALGWSLPRGGAADPRAAKNPGTHPADDRASPSAPPRPLSHACRFWGLAGTGYPSGLLRDHLQTGSLANLRTLGGYNRDGWGFSLTLPESYGVPLNHPLIRRGGPPADNAHDPDYDLAVDEAVRLRPKAMLGHVRAGTSGHWGIPNPHPFEHAGLSFAHNGTLDESQLVDLLTEGDPGFLESHPPDYVDGHIDSELYLLFLTKSIERNPQVGRTEAIRRAVHRLTVEAPYCRLNFVMTDGDTLYALRCAPYDEYDPVRYFPSPGSGTNPTGRSPFWVAASQIMGSTAEGWAEIPARSLAVFVPGEKPVFQSVEKAPFSGEQPEPGEDADAPAPAAEILAGPIRPNPASGRMVVPLRIPAEGAPVSLRIWDAEGRLVWSLGPRAQAGGTPEIVFDGVDASGRPLPAGSYVCRIQVGKRSRVEKLVLLR